MNKQTILRQVQETALAVYMYDQLYSNGIPTNVVVFEERALERFNTAKWKALDSCTWQEIDSAIDAVVPGMAAYC